MRAENSISGGTVWLTGSNLLLRVFLMGFQVYLSGRIGAAGIGLLQLVVSVKELAFTLGAAGIRTCTVYLSAEELGRGRPRGAHTVLTGCLRYSLICGAAAAVALWHFAPWLAKTWIGDKTVVAALRIYAPFLVVRCLCGVLDAYCTAAGRIRQLICVEFLEQFCSVSVIYLLLARGMDADAGLACSAVSLGNGAGGLLCLCALLWIVENGAAGCREEPVRRPPYRRILRTALPLGVADNLRSGLNTVENLIVPRQLAQFAGTVDAMADYGVIHGMVFPLMMLPAAILLSLSSLLVPELSRCAAGRRQPRVRYLARRSLRTALLFGLAAGGGLFVLAEPLGELLYHEPAAGVYLRLYAPLVPLLYTDIIADAVCKGLGHQDANARYNLLTSFLDVAILWLLLPRYGLAGYLFSFAVTHLLNFVLSFRRLIFASEVRPRGGAALRAALCAVAAVAAAGWLPRGEGLWGLTLSGACYVLFLLLLWTLFRVIGMEDLRWLRGLFRRRRAKAGP